MDKSAEQYLPDDCSDNRRHEQFAVELTSIFQSHREWLQLMAESRVGPRLARKLDADDVVQDIMFRALEAVDKFRGLGDLRSQRAWLAEILKTVVLDHYKRFKTARRDIAREQSPFPLVGGSLGQLESLVVGRSGTPSSIVSGEEQFQRIVACIHTMPEKVKEVIIERFMNDRPILEIASLTNESRYAITNRLRRGLEKLRVALAQKDEGKTLSPMAPDQTNPD